MYQHELINKIKALKEKRGAVILVHNYQPGPIQEVGDIIGDSLELARKATEVKEQIIVFCGVHFMAETAAILNPQRTVLLPTPNAGCKMADMVDDKGLRVLKAKHPDATVVCYVNSTAEVKAECDLCCTSANAGKIISSIPPNEEIIFVPDQFLGANIERQVNRKMIRWDGYCPVHRIIDVKDVARIRRSFPNAEIWAHPECTTQVADEVDFLLSTGQMVKRAHETTATIVAVATEVGMLYRLRKERPDITFVPVTEQAVCVDMKLTTLEDVAAALENMTPIVTVKESIRARAAASVQRMLSIK